MIVDAHAHIGHFRRASLATSEKMILWSIDHYHIDFSLISNGDAGEFTSSGRKASGQKSQYEANAETLRFVREHPDRLGALLWGKPYQETADASLEALIQQNRDMIFGFKFHPFASKVTADDPRMEPYYALARKYNLPLLFHTAIDRCSSILFLEKAAQKHPDLTFIAAHLELLSDNQTAIQVLKRNPNIYGDTAWVSPEMALETIRVCGPDKLLFGTDNPVDGYETLNHPYYHTFRSRVWAKKLGSEAYRKLMGENAFRIYHLSFPSPTK